MREATMSYTVNVAYSLAVINDDSLEEGEYDEYDDMIINEASARKRDYSRANIDGWRVITFECDSLEQADALCAKLLPLADEIPTLEINIL